jgi:hypothetical protein
MWLPVHSLYWWSIKIDLGVDNQERIVRIEHIVVDTHTIQILLQETLEEHVFFLKGSFLLLDGKLIQQNFVVTLVKVIQKLEFVVLLLFHTINFFNFDVRKLI